MKSEVDADTFTPRPISTLLLDTASLCAQVLREVGMKGEVDADTFTLCAQRVAESYAAAPDSHAPEAAAGAAMKAAEMLAAHLAAKADDLFAPHLFHMLGAIAFVPATRVRLVIRYLEWCVFLHFVCDPHWTSLPAVRGTQCP